MKAIEIAGCVLQEQRRWAHLAAVVTESQEGGVLLRIAGVVAHALIPFVGDRCQARIKHRAQTPKQVGQRILKVAILAPAEAVAGHVDVAAKILLVAVEGGDFSTLLSQEQFFEDRAAIVAQVSTKHTPVIFANALLCRSNGARGGNDA